MTFHIKRKRRHGGLIWTFLVLAGLGGAAGYYYLHPEHLPEWASRTLAGRELQTTTVYRWQDAVGNWHVSDQPPAGDIPYQTEAYSRDSNVLPLPPKLQQ
jgi:hypothetical protein